MKIVLILSSWSTGSSAVAGFLDKCGGYTCPPHHRIADERTPNTYEPREYRAALLKCVDEKTLAQKGSTEDFKDFFERWLPKQIKKAKENQCDTIVLKHALQSFLLPVIQSVCDPTCILVTRPFDKIERTRIRRNWGGPHGESGARMIYSATYSFLHDQSKPCLIVPYEGFRIDENIHCHLLQYVGISPEKDQLEAARNWLR